MKGQAEVSLFIVLSNFGLVELGQPDLDYGNRDGSPRERKAVLKARLLSPAHQVGEITKCQVLERAPIFILDTFSA